MGKAKLRIVFRGCDSSYDKYMKIGACYELERLSTHRKDTVAGRASQPLLIVCTDHEFILHTPNCHVFMLHGLGRRLHVTGGFCVCLFGHKLIDPSGKFRGVFRTSYFVFIQISSDSH